MNKDIHIFPFFSKNEDHVKIEHFCLEDDKAELRGMMLKKNRLNTKECPLYFGNKNIEERVFYWKIIDEDIFDAFDAALELTEQGIGFK